MADQHPIDDTDVRVMFARLESKLDVALARQGAKSEEHGRRLDSLTDDVRDLQRRVWSLPTLASVLSAASLLVAVWARFAS